MLFIDLKLDQIVRNYKVDKVSTVFLFLNGRHIDVSAILEKGS